MSNEPTGRPDLDDQDVDQVVIYVTEHLGEPKTWPTPDGYPNSLALCIIDAIQSIGVRYGSVINVVSRYTQSVPTETSRPTIVIGGSSTEYIAGLKSISGQSG